MQCPAVALLEESGEVTALLDGGAVVGARVVQQLGPLGGHLRAVACGNAPHCLHGRGAELLPPGELRK
eukprot:5851057-Pyramimonas_sp.AAC.1